MTSPTTRAVREPGSFTESNQSPPILPSRAPGRYRVAMSQPAIRGATWGSMLSWSVSATFSWKVYMRALSSTSPARAASSAPVVRSMSSNGSRPGRRIRTMKPRTTSRALSGTISRERWVISGRRSRFSNSPEIRLLASSLTYGMRTGSPVTMHRKNGVCSGKAMDSPTGTVSSQRPGSSLCSTQTRCQTVVTSGGPSGKPSPARTAARRCVPAKSVKRGTAALVTSRMVRSRSREVPMRPLTSLRNSSRSRTAAYSRSSSGRGTVRGAGVASPSPSGERAGCRGSRRGTPQSGVTGTWLRWLNSSTG
ncbi:hypothetical protein EES42_30435 [Streptomyces sp. ADI95-17]|nr:hypothetical protein EES42_30435 [Streptomyces sp. ADI95-17]